MQLKIKGLSSGKEVTIVIDERKDDRKNLLELLREHNFPIASSCRGEGICKLCVVNKKTLSCQISTREFLKGFGDIVEISYL